ncbi:tRNA (guanosine(37)-N1)-methyltransferase TrmD [Pantoea sp. Mhis]|uniref:tRNA (guanosine(37)-N1)-methyltransferase TrmD n=1 Tax=Pantoea sp. Mhis TaxID=2576759 RepID=UPI0013591AB2|nr:tRNA (guanosine(37)-N1)-methyltransferase TrmD [Pantoea sp. Mhis]MXP56627.1 tRNA (guanosine(37)-N1)-methyltransferase TrmD [Pantoea sp. Mhis]
MWIGIISLFPEMFHAFTKHGIIGRAIKKGFLSIEIWNPRNFACDQHRTVDDRPYGGGPGMLMMVQPLRDAIYAAKIASGNDNIKIIYLSPQGRTLNHQGVRKLATYQKVILICGRYEGIDERIIHAEVDEEWSIGDYVLSGGELPAMVLIETIARFIPNVLGKESSYEDSFSNGLLEYPHYTRPKILHGLKVPSVLLSGNHVNIRHWRLKQALGRTWLKRPELLDQLSLTKEQINLLNEFCRELNQQ